MRYILTGDHWGAREALRMGTIQEVAPNGDAALAKAVEIANKIAACAPLGIKTSLASSHMALEDSQTALAKLGDQYCDKYFATPQLPRASLVRAAGKVIKEF